MQKSKSTKFIIFLLVIILLIVIASIMILKSNPTDLTLSFYKKLTSNQDYTITLEGENQQINYSYRLIMAERGTDVSLDMNVKYKNEEDEEEEEHSTTLLTDGSAYIIYHDLEEYTEFNGEEVDLGSLIPTMSDIEGKEYQKGREEIKGKTYYYEEYADISTFLTLIDVDEDGSVKTRFYYDNDKKLVYIKNIVEDDGEVTEELIKATCTYNVDNSLFEIPSDYAESKE